MSTTSMFFDLFARDQGVAKSFSEISGHGKDMSGVLKGIGAAAASMGIAKMASDAVGDFKDVANSTLLLQRETGATAEDSSRLAFALSQAGMTAEDTKKGFGIFSKNLVAASQDGKKTADMTKELGFSFTDTHGKVLPLTDILPKLASTFESMPDGPEKTALALKLFGKSGQDMVPFLNRGGDAISELMKKSDDLGTTLEQNDVNAFVAARQESREWDASMRGLMITIGGALLPVLAGLEAMIHDRIIPVIQGFVGWFKSLPPGMQGAIASIGALILIGAPLILMFSKVVEAVKVAGTVIQGLRTVWLALNVAMNANWIALIVLAIAALVAGLIWAYNNVGWFKDFVNGAFAAIRLIVTVAFQYITTVLIPALIAGWQWLASTTSAVFNGISSFLTGVWRAISSFVIAAVLGFVTFTLGIWQTLYSVTTSIFSGISGFISGIWNGIRGFIMGAVSVILSVISSGWSGVYSATTGAFSSVLSFLGGVWSSITGGVSTAIGTVVSWFSGLGSRILGAVGNLGGLLLNIGSQIIGGLISGIQGALGGLGDVLGSVGAFIAAHKGPEDVDRVLLKPHGGWIIGGLGKSIRDAVPTHLGPALGAVTDSINSHDFGTAAANQVRRAGNGTTGNGGSNAGTGIVTVNLVLDGQVLDSRILNLATMTLSGADQAAGRRRAGV